MIGRAALAVLASVSACALGSGAARGEELTFYVGTYTGGANGSEGIYRGTMDAATGRLSGAVLAARTPNPTFLAIHPGGRFLYAVNEVGEFEGKATGSVSAFAIDPDSGDLKLLNQVSSEGTGPCHIAIDARGRFALVANYGGGSVASLPIGEDGRLGPAASAIRHEGRGAKPSRQSGPHAHSINLHPNNRLAVAADLGLDKLLLYDFDPETGRLSAHDPAFVELAPGAGPRHFAFDAEGRFGYAINELDNTVTVFDFGSDRARGGPVAKVQVVSTLPEGYAETSYTADVQTHPSGKFVYGSNRGHDSIAVFARGGDGKLSLTQIEPIGGKTPRNFAIDPSGRFLLAECQGTDRINVFAIDAESGRLSRTEHGADFPTPVCVKFLAPRGAGGR